MAYIIAHRSEKFWTLDGNVISAGGERARLVFNTADGVKILSGATLS